MPKRHEPRTMPLLIATCILVSVSFIPSVIGEAAGRDVAIDIALDSIHRSHDSIEIPVLLTGLGIDELYELTWTLYSDNSSSGSVLIQGEETWTSATINHNTAVTLEMFYDGQLWYEIEFELFESGTKVTELSERFSVFRQSLQPQFTGMFVFGDSLSDTGNTKDSWLNLPDVPPYYNGRFSNGPIWVDTISAELGFQLTHGLGTAAGEIRAFGGSQTGQGYSFFVIPNVGTQINNFLLNVQSNFSADDLIVLWAGGNDFIYGSAEPNETLANMASHITQLAGAGAETLFVPNLPPLETTPEMQSRSTAEQQAMADKIAYYNLILDSELALLRNSLGVNIISADTHSIFADLVLHKEYFGLTDVTSPACVSSGNLLPLPICNYGDPVASNEYEYLFFDKAHPTQTAHSIIAEYGLGALGEPDTDGDGVIDVDDACEWTPTNQSADFSGCSWQQLDDDGDGVLNGEDHCPGTALGDQVDAKGCSGWQQDSDGDGLLDAEDACPFSNSLSTDYDQDGCMDFEDADDDGDGVSDVHDRCPQGELNWTSTSSSDFDGDGCHDLIEDDDDDDDGLSDTEESAMGTDPFDSDTDDDGVLDGDDAFPLDPTQDSDFDQDGYGDDPMGTDPDSHPVDPTQWRDHDGDGHGDNPNGTDADAFPSDSTQWSDEDGDGYGDEPDGTMADGCPDTWGNSSLPEYGCPDSDGDGWRDEVDSFPFDPTEWRDSDGDGVGDNSDDFPEFSTQTTDSDGDGYGDNPHGVMPDAFPEDGGEWNDTDGDGVGDNSDLCISPASSLVDDTGCPPADDEAGIDEGEAGADSAGESGGAADDGASESGDYQYGESQPFFSVTSLVIVSILVIAMIIVAMQDKRGRQRD